MGYKVELLPEAREDLLEFERSQQLKILKGLAKLETAPEQFGAPLGSHNTGNLTGLRKLVVGKQELRIVYRVDNEAVVVVWVIAARAEDKCYKMAKDRIDTYSDRALAEQLSSVLTTAWGSDKDSD